MANSEWFGYFAALGTALSLALSSLFTVRPLQKLGVIRFNTLRMLMVFLMLAAVSAISGLDVTPTSTQVGALLLSGFVGIFLGDTLLFSAISRLGPRIAGLLFATNAPISFLLDWLVLGSNCTLTNLLGVIFVTTGVMIAIAFRHRKPGHTRNEWEKIVGSVKIATLIGLGAALCQALGTLIAQPVIKAGIDPVFASMLRVITGFLGLFVTIVIRGQNNFEVHERLVFRDYAHIAMSGWLAMGLGMTLLLWALDHAAMGIVATLSATTPILLLPLLWLVSKQHPTQYDIIGAITVVAGTGLLFLT